MVALIMMVALTMMVVGPHLPLTLRILLPLCVLCGVQGVARQSVSSPGAGRGCAYGMAWRWHAGVHACMLRAQPRPSAQSLLRPAALSADPRRAERSRAHLAACWRC